MITTPWLRLTLSGLLLLASSCKLARDPSLNSQTLDAGGGLEEPEACFDARLMEVHSGLINSLGNEAEAAKTAGFPTFLSISSDDGKTPAVGTALLSRDMSKIVVVFRGTANEIDVLTDLMFLPARRQDDGAVLHEGFSLVAHGYEKGVIIAIDQLTKQAKAAGKDPKIILSGHSLGGAIAVLTADLLTRAGKDVDQVVLFGTPRVGYRFRPVYRLMPRTRHYYVRYDPVPNVPLTELGYEELPARTIQMILPGTERETAPERLSSIAPDVVGKALDLFDDVSKQAWQGAGALLNGESPTIKININQYADPLLNKYITRHYPNVYAKMLDGLCASPEKQERDQMLVRWVHFDLYHSFPKDDDLRDLVAAFRASRVEGYAEWLEHEMLSDKHKNFYVNKAYRELHGKDAPPEDLARIVAKLKTVADFAKVEQELGAAAEPLGRAMQWWLEVHVGPMRDPDLKALGEKALKASYKLWEFRPRRGGYYFDRDGILRFIYENEDLQKTWVHWKQLLLKYDFDRLDQDAQAAADADALKLLRSVEVKAPGPKGKSPYREALTETLCLMMCDKAAFSQTIHNAYALFGYTAVGESTFDKYPRTCEAGNVNWLEAQEGKPVLVDPYVTDEDDEEADDSSPGSNGQEFAPFLMSTKALSRHSAKLLMRGCGGILYLHDELFRKIVVELGKDAQPKKDGKFTAPDP